MTLSEKLEIPLFPLSIFLLPGERIQLHIFEPRYLQLFAELESGASQFGIPYTTGRLTKGLGSRCNFVRVLKKYTSGELDVLVECEGIFELEDFQSMKADKLYPFGSVRLLRNLNQEKADSRVLQAYDELRENLVGTDLHFHVVDNDSSLAIMSSLNATHEEKHLFAKLPNASNRIEVLLGRIQMLNSLIIQEKATEQGIYLS